MKAYLLALTALLALPCFSQAGENAYFVLQSSVTSSAGSGRITPQASKVAFQATGRTQSGAGAVTVVIYGSLDGDYYVALGTVTLVTGTTMVSDGFTTDNAWRFYKSSVTAISGTGGAAWVYAGSKN